jgi:hypothetical protein
VGNITDTISKIKEIRKCPKEKNVVLGYLERKKTTNRFSPKPIPWHDYYIDL